MVLAAFATCFPMVLLLHQPPSDRAVVLEGPWAGRQGCSATCRLLGDFEGLFLPAMEGKTHPWSVSSNGGTAAMAALCMVVLHIWVYSCLQQPHIWAQLPTMLR